MIHPIIIKINEQPDDDTQIRKLEELIHGEYSLHKDILNELVKIVKAYNNLFSKMDKYVIDGVYQLTYLNLRSKMSKEKLIESYLRSFFSELLVSLTNVNNKKTQIEIISKEIDVLRQRIDNLKLGS